MRVVGKRKSVPGDRAGLSALVLKFGGGAPKGVFRYRTQEDANRDWDRWISERVQRRINVISLEGLLRMKENGRLKDRADAEAIRKALGR